MAVTFNSIAANVDSLTQFETDISALTAPGRELTTADLINLQKITTEWTLAANTYSTVIKTLGDSLRSTLQKIN